MKLKAPFPWFGGKSRVDDMVWSRFGAVRNYVEPFAGSLAVLLGRPDVDGTETVNDLDCYVANFWRAINADAVSVAAHADWPVNESDLHARHLWLVNQVEFRERMKTDPDFYDVRIAGWWVWGISCWIGGGWCALREKPWQQRPHLGPGSVGQGITKATPKRRPMLHPGKVGCGVRQNLFAAGRRIPDIYAKGAKGVHGVLGGDLLEWFGALSERLRAVRVCCGDWMRVLGDTPLGLTDNIGETFKTAVFLDPPYDHGVRDPYLYAQDAKLISPTVREWCLAHGDDSRLRIALCGYEGEHLMPDTWECVPWKAAGGYGNRTGNDNAHKERVWFSPHCLRPSRDRELFDLVEVVG